MVSLRRLAYEVGTTFRKYWYSPAKGQGERSQASQRLSQRLCSWAGHTAPGAIHASGRMLQGARVLQHSLVALPCRWPSLAQAGNCPTQPARTPVPKPRQPSCQAARSKLPSRLSPELSNCRVSCCTCTPSSGLRMPCARAHGGKVVKEPISTHKQQACGTPLRARQTRTARLRKAASLGVRGSRCCCWAWHPHCHACKPLCCPRGGPLTGYSRPKARLWMVCEKSKFFPANGELHGSVRAGGWVGRDEMAVNAWRAARVQQGVGAPGRQGGRAAGQQG